LGLEILTHPIVVGVIGFAAFLYFLKITTFRGQPISPPEEQEDLRGCFTQFIWMIGCLLASGFVLFVFATAAMLLWKLVMVAWR
jgi:hypothetical protein